MDNFGYINENYQALRREIKDAEDKYARKITLVCVTKSGSDDELMALVRAGATDIGENRPTELARRGELIRGAGFSPALHEIGNLQRNKVKYIIREVSLIHSLDSISLADEIEKQGTKISRRVPVLLEINSGREENKGGVMPEDAVETFRKLKEYPHLSLRGLMTMGPVCESEEARQYFRLTRELYDRIGDKIGYEGDGILSMGMSDSYRVAIEEGSTLVRVGRRLFINENKE